MAQVSQWKNILIGTVGVLLVGCASANNQPTSGPDSATTLDSISFGVGPYFPTPDENRQQFEPLFDALAAELDLPGDVTVTEDWIGISEALRSGTLDLAWLGPWGYVLAHHNDPSLEAIATVKYQDKPVYYGILIARADAPFDTLEEAIALSQQGEKLKLSLADVGSTSGWLIPQAEFKRRNIDPEVVFDYSEGASHAAQVIGVSTGQIDIASDYNRNLDVMIAEGRIQADEIKIIWQSEPLPNDPIVVRGNFPEAYKKQLQQKLVNLTPAEAATLLPENYTGFVASDGSNYQPIEAAGLALEVLK